MYILRVESEVCFKEPMMLKRAIWGAGINHACNMCCALCPQSRGKPGVGKFGDYIPSSWVTFN